MLGAYDVYATQLYQLNQGLPLWEPEPTHNGHALLGDVGFVQEGRFYRFFNTLRPANDDANRFGVPEGFRPLVLPSYLIHRTENALSQGPICSRTIRALQVGASVSMTQSTGMGFSFRCCEDQGAVLMLNDRADREIVLRNDIMHKYMIEHHDAWYQFARNTLGLAIKQEDIIFVRGLLQTSDWAGVAGFLQEGRASTLSFDAGSVAPFSVAFSVAALKEISAPIQWRTGPRRDGDLKKDQTLFLQFYKLKKRIILGPRVVKAASEPRDMKPSSSDDHDIARILADEGAESSDEELVEIVPARRQQRLPVDCVLNYILEYSDARAAIASDDILSDLFEGDIPSNLEDIGQLLELLSPVVTVDEYGVGTISPQYEAASKNGNETLPKHSAPLDIPIIPTLPSIPQSIHSPDALEDEIHCLQRKIRDLELINQVSRSRIEQLETELGDRTIFSASPALSTVDFPYLRKQVPLGDDDGADEELKARTDARIKLFCSLNRAGNALCAWHDSRRERRVYPPRAAPPGQLNCGCTYEEALFEECLARHGVGSYTPGEHVRMDPALRNPLLKLLQRHYGYHDGDFERDPETGEWIESDGSECWEAHHRKRARIALVTIHRQYYCTGK